jgi:hypothetical protein
LKGVVYSVRLGFGEREMAENCSGRLWNLRNLRKGLQVDRMVAWPKGRPPSDTSRLEKRAQQSDLAGFLRRYAVNPCDARKTRAAVKKAVAHAAAPE